MKDQDQKPSAEPGRPLLLPSAILVYSLAVVLGGIWLHARDRLQVLPSIALGRHGALVSLAAGVLAGFSVYALLYRMRRHLRMRSELGRRVLNLLRNMKEVEIVGLSLVSAVGEEFFFRGAMHDSWGYISALVFGLFYSGPGMLVHACLAVVLGLLFSLMMEWELGLLSVTLAHALIKHGILRRMVNE